MPTIFVHKKEILYHFQNKKKKEILYLKKRQGGSWDSGAEVGTWERRVREWRVYEFKYS